MALEERVAKQIIGEIRKMLDLESESLRQEFAEKSDRAYEQGFLKGQTEGIQLGMQMRPWKDPTAFEPLKIWRGHEMQLVRGNIVM